MRGLGASRQVIDHAVTITRIVSVEEGRVSHIHTLNLFSRPPHNMNFATRRGALSNPADPVSPSTVTYVEVSEAVVQRLFNGADKPVANRHYCLPFAIFAYFGCGMAARCAFCTG